MINRRIFSVLAGGATAVALTATALIAGSAQAEVATGEPAPAFTLTNTAGESVSLSDFEGQVVVLEWTNPGCPFVVKHYDSQATNMQDWQAASDALDYVWLTINSTNPEHRDYLDADALQAQYDEWGSNADHILIDADGTVGKAFGAQTTPHMYVINEAGNVVYQGAIDSVPSTDVADIADATNYLDTTFAALDTSGEPDPAATKAYGCSIKY